jgi:hypothetical protein
MSLCTANDNLPQLTAEDDSYSYVVAPGTSTFRMDLNILANDEGLGKYISSYFTTSTSFRGTVSISSDGQVMTYRLLGQYDGSRFTDVLTYTVRDGRGASAQASVSIRIAPGE